MISPCAAVFGFRKYGAKKVRFACAFILFGKTCNGVENVAADGVDILVACTAVIVFAVIFKISHILSPCTFKDMQAYIIK